MNYFWKVLLLCFISIPVAGQKNISITGQLMENDTDIPVEQATVRLLALPDSSLVTGTSTGKDGKFTLKNVSTGNFLILFSYIGYQNLYKNIQISGKTTTENLGKLNFYTDDIMLQETVVTAKANEIVVKKDTIEYNAASYKTEENAVVEDLLKKLPGVEVDAEGKITVGGKEIKKILVDGKEFFSDDPKVASKNLPVNMIEKLQVLDQKSDMAKLTGFEDGDEQTVINLTVKPGMKKATIGNAAASIGKDINPDDDLRYEVTGMLNGMNNNDRYTLLISGNNTNNMGATDMGGNRFGGMRGMRRGGSSGINTSEMFALNINKEFSDKLTLNGDINYNSSDRDSERRVNRVTDFRQEGEDFSRSLIEETKSWINDQSDNVGANFRLEWKPDENNTLIFRPNFSYNKSNSTEKQDFLSLNRSISRTDSIAEGTSTSYSEGSGHAFGGTLEYAHQFSKQGRVFSISLSGNYNESYSQEFSDWNRSYFQESKDSTLNQQSENDNKSQSFRAYTSYVEPLGNNYFLQLAYRISKSDLENINSTYDIIPNTDTAVINNLQSRSTVRNTIEQRISLNLKSMREKYNFTVGLNIDPSYSNNKTHQPSAGYFYEELIPGDFDGRLQNVLGDSIVTLKQNVINLSPNVNFVYNFGERTNLRIDYSGSTSQPTANQLNGNPSNPQNIIEGNPNLKPGYTNTLSARFDKFVPDKQLFYNARLRGGFSMNDISSVITIDPTTSNRITRYENINGNWNVNFMAMFNMPLRNKKFSINNFFNTSYQNSKGYTNGLLNTMKTFNLRERAGINYRSDLFDVGLNGSFALMDTRNEINQNSNRRTYDYGITGLNTWYLPYNFTVNADITWNTKSGYSDGFNRDETILNASVTKQVFNKKAGTGSVRVKVFDILQDRKSISRSVGDNYIQDVESNSLQSFFLCSLIYRFNIFPAGSSAKSEDMEPSREYHRRQGGGGGGGRRFGPQEGAF